jgi:gas vesicle protein
MVMKEGLTHKKNSILTPVLIGTAVGAGTALLIAPKSGKELRKDLKRISRKTGRQVAEVIDEGRDIYVDSRKAVARFVDNGKKMYEEGAERLDKLVHKKKERSFTAPLVAGGILAGAAVALLLAPKSGKALRKDIKEIAADAGEKVDSVVEKGKNLYKEVGKKIAHAA